MAQAAPPQDYDVTHEQYMYDQAKLMRDQMGEISAYYKLGESLYSYKNLEGQTNVSISNYQLIIGKRSTSKTRVKKLRRKIRKSIINVQKRNCNGSNHNVHNYKNHHQTEYF